MIKSSIRKIYKQKRLALKSNEVIAKSAAIAKNFTSNLVPQLKDFKNKKLAFYIAANNEVDPVFIMKNCTNIFALPKISGEDLELEFKEYRIGDKLVKNNRYLNLLEPQDSKENIIPDIIFVPLVAFDKNCNRIGMGGGFYDATIENFRKKYSKIIFIGLGYDTQECQIMEADEHDQSLDFIISETRIISCSQ